MPIIINLKKNLQFCLFICHCCLHAAASCMNSHCQQYDLAVLHTGSDPLRRVQFTAEVESIVFDIQCIPDGF